MTRLVSAQLLLGRCWHCRKGEGGLFHCSHQQFGCHSPCKYSHASVIVAQRSWAGDLTLQQGNLQKESPEFDFPDAPPASSAHCTARGLAEARMSGWSPRKLTRVSSPLPGDLQERSSAERPGMIPGQLPTLKNNNMEL